MAEMSLETSYALPSIGAAQRTVFANQRTLEILEQRRASGKVRRRGWLMRRMLVLADVVALATTFALVELAFGAGSGAHHHFGAGLEYAVLLATIPGWILIARVYGLYEQDEERTHHPTSDELSRVFHLVTVGVWLLFVGEWLFGAAAPDLSKAMVLWALAIAFITVARSVARFCAGAASRTCRTR